ncbi:MAG: hypothetical protein R3178_02870 [Rhodothermales bacterium]|nr:hypothetical protein [Rhodothermales bacterium]
MDFFDFLILAALALPAIFRWLGDQSRKSGSENQEPVSSPPGDTDEAVESEFERALREIGRALGGEPVDEAPQPVPDPVPEPDAEVRQRRSPTRREDEEWLEESFEAAGSEALRRASAEPFRRLKLRRIDVPDVMDPVDGPRRRKPRARALLGRPGGARDAIVFSEVLRPPLAMRDPDEV